MVGSTFHSSSVGLPGEARISSGPRLADVMDQRGPVEQVELVFPEPELLADQLGMAPDALGVTAGEGGVLVEAGDTSSSRRVAASTGVASSPVARA